MKNVYRLLSVLAILMAFISCNSVQESADLVVQNAQIYTVDDENLEAEAMAVRDGRILFVGSNEEVKKYIGSATEVVDAGGKFIMPGFMEGHGHIHGLGSSLENLNLTKAQSFDEIVNLVKQAVERTEPGEWIVGRGWHQEKWTTKPSENFLGYPYHDALSAVSPNNPVVLTHASGHSVFVNAKALELAEIDGQTPNPAGGDIVKDGSGRITGALEERAMDPVFSAMSNYTSEEAEENNKNIWWRQFQLAEAECVKKGVTSFVDAGSSFKLLEWMRERAARNELQIRHWVMIRAEPEDLKQNHGVFPVVDEGKGHLSSNAVKVSLDGALGSYGAWLLQPYADRAGFYGQNTFDLDSLRAIAEICWENNIQLCVHCIGDRANREIIDIYEAQIKKDSSRDHRWRVEHAQHVDPAEVPRFAKNKIIASMQGVHCTSDAPYVEKRLGATRAELGAYVWQSFMKANVLVNNGTDAPVEDVDPIPNFYASVTRKLPDGSAFYPNQKMSRHQAVYSYTLANAIAQKQEKNLGSLQKGKYADFVILSNNLISCTDEEINTTQVLKTFVGGKQVYSAD